MMQACKWKRAQDTEAWVYLDGGERVGNRSAKLPCRQAVSESEQENGVHRRLHGLRDTKREG